MFTTYGIFHPQTCACVYIGQTGDFSARTKAHQTAHREREPKAGSLQDWLKALHKAKLKPNIVALELVQTERESLASEEKWVGIFCQIGHPLRNGWIEHQAIIATAKEKAASLPPMLVAKEFPERKRSEKAEPVIRGYAALNKYKTGYRLNLFGEEGTIDLLPPKEGDPEIAPPSQSLKKQFSKPAKPKG